MGAMHYFAAHSWNLSHHLSTSDIFATLHTKTSNTSQNVSATTIQFPMQMNSNVLAQPQQWRHQTTVLRAQTQPQNGMQTQIQMKTYLILLKPSLEALKTSTTEMLDTLKTLARALKLQQRALALSAQRQHQSYSRACRMKCKLSCTAHCH